MTDATERPTDSDWDAAIDLVRYNTDFEADTPDGDRATTAVLAGIQYGREQELNREQEFHRARWEGEVAQQRIDLRNSYQDRCDRYLDQAERFKAERDAALAAAVLLAEASRAYLRVHDSPFADPPLKAVRAALAAFEAGGEAASPPTAGAGAVTGEIIGIDRGDPGFCRPSLFIGIDPTEIKGLAWREGTRVAVVPLADAALAASEAGGDQDSGTG